MTIIKEVVTACNEFNSRRCLESLCFIITKKFCTKLFDSFKFKIRPSSVSKCKYYKYFHLDAKTPIRFIM